MFDAKTLSSQNCYKDVEQVIPHKFGSEVVLFIDTHKNIRFCHVASNKVDCKPFDSCLIVDGTRTIRSVFTRPDMRRRKIAKQLLIVARIHLGKVRHSEHLTDSGELWRDSVESFK